MRVLVTGASGFVGRGVLARAAVDSAVQLRAAVRRPSPGLPARVEPVLVGDLETDTNWQHALSGVHTVVHAAARVHVMRDTAVDPLAEFRRVNVAGTLNLARQAVEAGVRRLIFLSSIKVNGESTRPGHPYAADDRPAPVDPYGISKLEAEVALRELGSTSGLDVVVIRPVLVYGPGVKGNFRSMMQWLQRGVPLPFGAIHDNRRSLVALDTLADLIVTCTHHPAAANQTFLVSDGEDLSTTALLRRMAAALGKRARLIPVPASILRETARLLGRPELAQRLCGSLQVDASRTRSVLGWVPPVSVEEGLRRTADAL